jgi:hypothetical protein
MKLDTRHRGKTMQTKFQLHLLPRSFFVDVSDRFGKNKEVVNLPKYPLHSFPSCVRPLSGEVVAEDLAASSTSPVPGGRGIFSSRRAQLTRFVSSSHPLPFPFPSSADPSSWASALHPAPP